MGPTGVQYLHQVVVGSIQILVQLNHQTLEEGGELALHLVGIAQLCRRCLLNGSFLSLNTLRKDNKMQLFNVQRNRQRGI